jgi:hypothetical protein
VVGQLDHHPEQPTAPILKAPIQLPAGFFQAFGYQGGHRFVALFGEPCGDESCSDDGVSYACGMSDNGLSLRFIHWPEVWR